MIVRPGVIGAAIAVPVPWRQVTTRAMTPNFLLGSQQMMSRFGVRSPVALTKWRVIIGNWYPAAFVDSGAGAPMDVEMAIEYPIGTYTRVTFGGSNAGNIQSGTDLASDDIMVPVPADTIAGIRLWRSCAAGLVVSSESSGMRNTAFYDTANVGAASANLVMGGAITYNAGSANVAPPIAVIQGDAVGAAKSWILVGDSRGVGASDTVDASGDFGYARLLTPHGPYINISLGADRAAYVAAGQATKRLANAAYCTDVVLALGTNDLRAGTTATALIAHLQTIRAAINAAYPGRRYYLTTLSPFEPANGASNTVPHAANAARAAYNAAVRAGSIPNFTGYYEWANRLETATDSGIWASMTYCSATDYLHITQAGYLKLLENDTLHVYGAAPATTFSDTFNRADGALSGGDWTVLWGSATAFDIASNAVLSDETTETAIACPNLSIGPGGAYVEADIRALVNGGGLALMQDASNYIVLRANSGSGSLSISGKSGGASFGPTNSAGTGALVGQRLRLELTGTAWTTKLAGATSHSGSIAAALTNIRGGFVNRVAAGINWDNFTHGAL